MGELGRLRGRERRLVRVHDRDRGVVGGLVGVQLRRVLLELRLIARELRLVARELLLRLADGEGERLLVLRDRRLLLGERQLRVLHPGERLGDGDRVLRALLRRLACERLRQLRLRRMQRRAG